MTHPNPPEVVTQGDREAEKTAWRERTARVIGHHVNDKAWWWKPDYDDGHEETANRLRDEDRACADQISVPYAERLEYEERILAAEMDLIRIKRKAGMQVERPFAYCCAETGGHVEACDCVNKNHGTAWFDGRPSLDEIKALVERADIPMLSVGEMRHAGAWQVVRYTDGGRGCFCEVQAPLVDGDFDHDKRAARSALIVAAVNYVRDLLARDGEAHRLRHTPDREAIARVIEPWAMQSFEDWLKRGRDAVHDVRGDPTDRRLLQLARDNRASMAERRQTALAKADAIIAMIEGGGL